MSQDPVLTFEHAAKYCPACGHKGFTHIWRSDNFRMHECESCHCHFGIAGSYVFDVPHQELNEFLEDERPEREFEAEQALEDEESEEVKDA